MGMAGPVEAKSGLSLGAQKGGSGRDGLSAQWWLPAGAGGWQGPRPPASPPPPSPPPCVRCACPQWRTFYRGLLGGVFGEPRRCVLGRGSRNFFFGLLLCRLRQFFFAIPSGVGCRALKAPPIRAEKATARTLRNCENRGKTGATQGQNRGKTGAKQGHKRGTKGAQKGQKRDKKGAKKGQKGP